MSALIANEDLTLDIAETATTSATLTATGTLSTNLKAGSKFVYVGDLNILINNATDGVCTQSLPNVKATIKPTSTKVKSNNNFVIRENDEGDTLNVAGLKSDGTTACTISITPVVKTAGQTKVKAK